MITAFYGKYSAFLLAFLLGVFFGVLDDVFRILRISRLPYLIPKGKFYEFIKIPSKEFLKGKNFFRGLFKISNNLITFSEDIAFWIITSICEVLFIYHINGGNVRIYFIMCTFLGAAVYFFTLGKLTMYFSVRIIFLLRCLLYWLFYIIIYPIRIAFLILKKIFGFIARITILPIVNAVKIKRANDYSAKRAYLILDKSKKGFCTK
ncbi:MAG: spore cortex biosynthesis protein YabQ [Clostridia bacterium]|nr:spore cortex biosynthesis protein YabQ [Clostridia bacterium]